MNLVEKKWGLERWYINDQESNYCCKELVLQPGWQCSLHCHKLKAETFYVLSGHCTLEYGSKVRILGPGDSQKIEVEIYHRFSLGPETKEPCFIMEVSNFHRDSDSYRLTESQRVQ